MLLLLLMTPFGWCTADAVVDVVVDDVVVLSAGAARLKGLVWSKVLNSLAYC